MGVNTVDEVTGITPTTKFMRQQVSLILEDKVLKQDLIKSGYLRKQSTRQTRHTMKLKRLMGHWCLINGRFKLMPIETLKIATMDLDSDTPSPNTQVLDIRNQHKKINIKKSMDKPDTDFKTCQEEAKYWADLQSPVKLGLDKPKDNNYPNDVYISHRQNNVEIM